MKNAGLEAVWFDLDDTVIVDDPATWAAFDAVAGRAAAESGVEAGVFSNAARELCIDVWKTSAVYGLCDRLGIHGYECLWGRFDDPELGALGEWCGGYRRSVWGGALERCGISDASLAVRIGEAFTQERRARLRMMPGAAEGLERLRGEYRLGLLTNGAPSLQREKIDTLELAPRFEAIVVSGEVGVGKPDRAIFEEAASRLGVALQRCAMVGNSLTRDIAGAGDAGMRTVWFHVPGCGDEGVARPDAVVRHWAELPAALAALD